jgi:hypothetical protein
MFLEVTFLVYVLSNIEPVVTNLPISFLFDLCCSEICDDDYDDVSHSETSSYLHPLDVRHHFLSLVERSIFLPSMNCLYRDHFT